jgi:hypothetical protein
MSVPAWVKLLRRTDQLVWYAYRFHAVLRDELLFAWLDPAQRDAVTQHAYSRQHIYLPGGATFERGLFDWEKTALALPQVPRTGRVLLGAAGGGRELQGLAAMGYEVTAFEPNPTLLEGTRAIARRWGDRVTVLQGTYDDMIAAACEGTGPLASLRERGGFDLVIFGWGSFTHVIDPSRQRELLRAAHALAPQAPLLLSFFTRQEAGDGPVGNAERLRRRLRHAFALLGRPSAAPAGLGYEAGGGFVYSFTVGEIQALAFEAGYLVERFEPLPFPHALLQPLAAAPASC